jgi:hypothetical protein
MSPLPQNTWVHLAVAVDATNARRYVNGVETMSHNISANPILPNAGPVTIGRGSDFIGVFVGAIDSVRIYNRALSAAEIAAIAADKS